MLEYREVCLKVCDIAREAGAYIAEQRESFSFSDVEFKGSQNMVSYVDKTAEAMIVEKLKEITPDAGFITEEGTVAEERNKSVQWIIDPLDGTTNFVHDLPPYCVSIALNVDEETVVGVVYEITRDEIFYSWRGAEAYMNGVRMQVSKTDSLENSLIAIGFSYSTTLEVEDFLESIAYFQRNTNGVRRIGSATADLVYVACGRVDGFYQVKLSPWDVAAGAFLVKQAGGIVTDYKGGDDYIFGREIIASNTYIYDEFLQKIR